jgi:hypothetical protein
MVGHIRRETPDNDTLHGDRGRISLRQTGMNRKCLDPYSASSVAARSGPVPKKLENIQLSLTDYKATDNWSNIR